MALVDEMRILARGGKGGNGVVRWLHLKSQEYSGPSGGNGGHGGEGQTRDGKGGSDLIIDLPVGSIVRNESTGEVHELLKEGQLQLVLKGGRGGAGNAVFK